MNFLKYFFLLAFLFSCGGKDQSPAVPGPNSLSVQLSDLSWTSQYLYSYDFHHSALSYQENSSYRVTHYLGLSKMDSDGMLDGFRRLLIEDINQKDLITYGEYVLDYVVMKDYILTIEKNEDSGVEVKKVLFDGTVKFSKALMDPTYNNDACYAEFDIAIGKRCGDGSSGEVRLYSHFSPYQQVQLRKSNLKEDEFYFLIDTHRFSSNVYHIKANENGFTLYNKYQVMVHNNLEFIFGVSLINGSELHTLNRFGKRMEKIFTLTSSDDVIFGYNPMSPKPMNKFLGFNPVGLDDEGKAKRYSYFLKLDKDLVKLQESFEENFLNDDADYFVTAPYRGGKLTFGVTSTFQDSNNQYNFKVLQLDPETMTLKASQEVHLAKSDYLTSLAVEGSKVYAASFSDVGQNSKGYSISGYGAIGFSVFNENLEKEKSFFFKTSSRKNLLKQFEVSSDEIRGLIDINGPVTHTADRNEELNRQNFNFYNIDLKNSKMKWY